MLPRFSHLDGEVPGGGCADSVENRWVGKVGMRWREREPAEEAGLIEHDPTPRNAGEEGMNAGGGGKVRNGVGESSNLSKWDIHMLKIRRRW